MLWRVKSIVKLYTLFTTLDPENHTRIGQIRECPPLPPAGLVYTEYSLVQCCISSQTLMGRVQSTNYKQYSDFLHG